MQPIQLPTSTDQLANQFFRHLQFVVEFDVKNPGTAAHYPEFLATFNKQAEINRLLRIALALDDGVKTLTFA